jgi:putative transposase
LFGSPKYRKIVLDGQVKDELRIILTNECKELKLEMLALEIMPDHLHLFIGAKSTHIPCVLVKQLKGVSSIQLREQFPELTYLGYPRRWKQFPHLWARGYYCGSAGHVSQDAVKRYILLSRRVRMCLSTASTGITLARQRLVISPSEKKV